MQASYVAQLQMAAAKPCWRPVVRDVKGLSSLRPVSTRIACFGGHQINSRRESFVARYRHAQKQGAAGQDADASQTAEQQPEAAAADATNADFIRRRLFVFVGIVLGYTSFYLTRGSLTYAAPALVADPALGLDRSAVAAMTSIFPMAYGVSKFVSGVVGTSVSARLMLGLGLMATAAVNLAFGASSSLALFCGLWGLNGMLQGVGAPSCASILTRWFASKERGTYWGMWNIAHNLGGFLAPVIIGSTVAAMGWRWGMWTAGLIGTVVGLGVLVAVRDKPQDCGFPPVDDGSAAKKKEEAPAAPTTSTATEAGATSAAATKEGTPAPTAAAAAPAQAEMGMMGALQSVLKLPGIWALAFTYFFIYMVRQGVTSWLVWYLIAEKGAANAGQAALAVSGLELGGLAGSTVAGFLSDMNIRKSKGGAGHVGKRIQVCMLYTVGIAACLLGLQAVPATASALQWITIAGLGFCIYGPQMLIGLSGAELVSPKAVGASQGILGWIAYLGAAFAGIPLAAVMDAKGYNGFFAALLGACAVALVLLTTQANAQSFLQRQDKATPGGSSGAAAPATA